MRNLYILLGALYGAIGVGSGALGAHALKTKLSPSNLSAFETASEYMLLHAVLLLFLGWMIDRRDNKILRFAAKSLSAGILLFSGSLFLLSTRSLSGLIGMELLGPITPLGGLLMILTWILLAFYGLQKYRGND